MKLQLQIMVSLFMLMSGCNSSADLLTKQKWVLYARSQEGGRLEYFKHSDLVMALNFKSNGEVVNSASGGEVVITQQWYWDEVPNYLIVEDNSVSWKLNVRKLDEEDFIVAYHDSAPGEVFISWFKHPSDKGWTDSEVERLNRIDKP